MKAFVAILLTLILVAAQSGVATTSSVASPAYCGCGCASGCADTGCSVGKSNDTLVPQLAAPAPGSSETELSPLLLALRRPAASPPRPALSFPA